MTKVSEQFSANSGCEHRKLNATVVGDAVVAFCPDCKWSGEMSGLPVVEGGRFVRYYGGCKVIRTNNLAEKS